MDVEDAVVMFRQVYMGLSFEMSFLGGLIRNVLPNIYAPFTLIEMLDSAVRHIFLTYLSVGAKKYKKGT